MKNWRNFDWYLVGIPVVMVSFGSLMLYVISHWAQNVPSSTPYRQGAYLLTGLFFFWLMTNIDYKVIRRLVWPAYVLVLAGLLYVSRAGLGAYGSTRWINLGFIQLQPSEPAKLVVVLALAHFLANRADRMGELTTLLGALVIVAVPALVVLREPDFGTAMVLCAIWFAAMVMASTPVVYMAAVFAAVGVMTPIAWGKVLKPFQRDRLISFLHPGTHISTYGYSQFHAEIAVGSGGFLGEWFSRGTQSRLNFLTVQDKDFIFSVIAEQIGFIGILFLFAFYAALFMRIARVAFMAADTFGRLVATGVLAMFLFQTFVNVGMNIGLMPVTGIPLPLMSYGGSSLITSLAALGILESVLLRHQKLIFNRGQSIL
ncbi:MAG TPA: rod shape-determining protein RodA [Chloroflexota bacterium]|jgi:rod shape determining protein RodA|nr:rod shape-determining protein RodA [Chloroflexota bacterium]